MPKFLLFVVLLAVAVPFQATLAVSAGQQASMEQCHDGHDGHAKPARSHCGACCVSAAIASVIDPLSAAPTHEAVNTAPDLQPVGNLPDGIDRPPRSL